MATWMPGMTAGMLLSFPNGIIWSECHENIRDLSYRRTIPPGPTSEEQEDKQKQDKDEQQQQHSKIVCANPWPQACLSSRTGLLHSPVAQSPSSKSWPRAWDSTELRVARAAAGPPQPTDRRHTAASVDRGAARTPGHLPLARRPARPQF